MPATNFQQILDPISPASEDVDLGVRYGLYALERAESKAYAQQYIVILEGALRKFQEWSKIWKKKASGPDSISEWVWGKRGREDIRTLLETASGIANTMVKKAAPLSPLQPSMMSKMVAFVRPQRKSEESPQRYPDLGDLAMQLSQTVNILCMYSHFIFDSRNAPRDPIILESVRYEALEVRRGFIALYRRCCQWGLDCSLDLHVWRFPEHYGKDDSSNCLTCRLLAVPRVGGCPVKDISISILYNPGPVRGDLITEHVDFNVFPEQVKGKYIRLSPEKDDIATLIEMSEGPVSCGEGTLVNLRLPLSREDKIGLAFKLVETGYYLLGTPWFASLSLKGMRRLAIKKRSEWPITEERIGERSPYQFFFDVKQVGTGITNRPFAAETEQLFKLGMVLMEIARNKHEDLPNEGRDLEIAKRLLEVEQSMGPDYCKATAYCLMNREPPMVLGQLAHDQLRKYEEPGLSVWWKLYLPGFLQSYYTQVYLQYVFEHMSQGSLR